MKKIFKWKRRLFFSKTISKICKDERKWKVWKEMRFWNDKKGETRRDKKEAIQGSDGHESGFESKAHSKFESET